MQLKKNKFSDMRYKIKKEKDEKEILQSANEAG